MRHVAVATLLLSAVALPAWAQTSAITIRGRVVADESGDAIANARVAIVSNVPGGQVVLTDGGGQFALTAPSGAIRFVVSKTGYARQEVTRPAADQRMQIRLQRGAAVSGRIVDEFGDPLQAARVAAQPAVGPSNAASTTETDDLGEYRLASLPAGVYVIAVTYVPRNGTTYYPGVATAAEAQPLHLESGEDRPRIDFVLPADRTGVEPFSIVPLGPLLSYPVTPIARDGHATGVVRGRVVSTDGRGLPHALVRLLTTQFQSVIGRADADARFEFRDLPAARFSVVASKTGYSLAASVPPFDLTEAETHERVEVTLARWGTLSGHVVDEIGDPIQAARVSVLQVRYEVGRRRLVPAANTVRLTDDLGRYRLHSLPPGRYVVSASVGDVGSAELPGYARAYYPGTASASDAQFVSVGLSQDVTGIDFSLSRTPTVRVAGRRINAAGEPEGAGSLTLTPSQRSTSVTGVPLGARIQPDGQFEFTNITPGQYIIKSSRGRSNAWTEGEFGSIPVSVNGSDVNGLVLQTSLGSTIKGRFRFDTRDRSKTPPRSGIGLSPVPIDLDLSPGSVASADIHDDWTFDIAGVNGPRRLQLTRAPSGWALQEIRVNGVDATDRPLAFGRPDQSLREIEVVLTDRVSELSGTITNDRDEAAPGAKVIVFTTDRGRWYPASRFLRTAAASREGAFSLTGLPFGTYYTVAVARLPEEEGADAWQDSEFLNAVMRFASTITIRDGEKQTITLRLTAQ